MIARMPHHNICQEKSVCPSVCLSVPVPGYSSVVVCHGQDKLIFSQPAILAPGGARQNPLLVEYIFLIRKSWTNR